MSLNPVSYLQTWEHNLAAARHRYQSLYAESESDVQDETYHDLPESLSSSASFLSRFSQNSFGHRLNIYPYTGDDVTHVRSNEISPVRGIDSADIKAGDEEERTLSKTRGAYEVSCRKRIVQVLIALISCFLSSGIIFGFAALKPILIQDGVYRNQCLDDELQERTVCYPQELRLNLMFAVASGTYNISVLPVGAILNAYGPRISGIFGSFSLILGSLLLAFAGNIPFDAYIPGYLFLAIGGSMAYISSLHLSNAFPMHSSIIYPAITGAFNSSNAVFLLFSFINSKSNGQFSTQLFFLVYLIVPVFVLAMQFLIMPGTPYRTRAELVLQAYTIAETNDRVDGAIPDPAEAERRRSRQMCRQNTIQKIQLLLKDESENLSNTRKAVYGTGPCDPGYIPQIQPPRRLSKDWPTSIMEGYPLSNQMGSPWLVIMTVFTALQILRMNYFIASLHQQYESLLSPDLARQMNQAFDILLPIGGLISTPLTRIILDKAGFPSILASLVALATVVGIIGCIPTLWAGYLNIALYVLYRPFFLAVMSDYVAKVFGLRTYGVVFGLAVSLAGIGNFAMPGLDALTLKVFGRDPIPANVILTGVTFVAGAVLVWFVLSRTRAVRRAREGGSVERDDLAGTDENEPQTEEDLERGPLLHRRSQHGKRRYGSTDL